jgi:hypothetical protein
LIKYTQNPRHKLPWVEYARQARLNIPCKPGLAMVVDVPGKAEELQAVLRGLSFGRKIASVRGNCAFFGTVATPNHQARYHGNREAGGPDFLPTRTNMESPKVR